VTPSKEEVEVARRLVARRTDEEVRQRMAKLEKISKGIGWPMYESLKIVLEERKGAVTI